MSVNVLFVCLGNICRSPTAHGVFLGKLAQQGLTHIEVDSAGTASWHTGKQPDPRTIKAAAKRDYDLTPLRARQAIEADFEQYDYILAMDANNLTDLEAIKPAHYTGHLSLFLDFLPEQSSLKHFTEVPDPYYEGAEGFEIVLDLVEQACDGLLEHITHKA